MTDANNPPPSPPPQGPPAGGDNPPAPDLSTGIQAGRPASTAIQAAPPATASETSIPLPAVPSALRKQTSPEQLARELARLDWGLIGVTLVLAFMLASFAVRNTDFWMHLASGRLLAHGQYTFGVDPFTYTSTGRYWANHSWLADLMLYGLASLAGGPESLVGGAVLVIAKALLVTALAWVMLQIRRPGQSLWTPACCTALALVAMSPRLLLQPTLISLLFLALTLYLLQYPRHEEGSDRRQERGARSPLAAYWLLPPLFLLWVNLDSWFFLGPVTVGLYLLGQTLQRFTMPIRTGVDAPDPRQLSTLLLVLLAGLVATLLNPHHYHAWTLPYELSLATPVEVLQRDSLLKAFFFWFLQEEYTSGQGWNLAALAYYPLIVLGLTSFVLSFFAGFRWWRLLVWLPFVILSFYHIRTVAFLAVVTGPIAALNLQDYCVATFGRELRVERGWKLWSIVGRVVTLVLGLGLVVATWPGWLHAKLGEARASDPRQRRASLTVEVDPSLRQTAAQLRDWRSRGLLPADEHGFNYTPDVVNYCAWFCADENGLPLEKGFYDYRLSLFPEDVAADYVGLRHAFRDSPGQTGDSGGRAVKWPVVFRKQHINHIVLNYNDPAAELVAVRLLADWQQWTLLYMDGRSTILRWTDPRLLSQRRRPAHGESSPLKRFDPSLLAFGPPAVADRAPSERLGRAPAPQPLWSLWLYGPPSHSLEADKAARYLLYYFQISGRWLLPYLSGQEWASWAGTTGVVATSPGSGTIAAPLTLALSPFRLGWFSPTPLLRGTDFGPPAMPLLAVRAARRAIAASPDDAQAYFALAQAYDALWTKQEEFWVSRQPTIQLLYPRQKLRQVQLTTALEYGLRLQPDDEEAHFKLHSLYRQMEYYDLALEHLTAAVGQAEASGLRKGESREDYKARIETLKKELKNLSDSVKNRQSDFELRSRDRPLAEKVGLARNHGLAKKALELLVYADASQIDVREAVQQLELLLTMGRLDTQDDIPGARERLQPELKPSLGFNYAWYMILLAAASGDYEQAGRAIDEAMASIEHSSTQIMLRLLQAQAFQGVINPSTFQALNGLLEQVRQNADFLVLRGMLALEEGDNPTAAKYFQQALDMSDQARFDFESRVLAVRYLQLIKAAGGDR